MTDFSVYLTSIGNDYYQVFIKNNHSETDFVRIIIGYTEILKGERVGRVLDSWIISPLKISDEHVFIQSANKLILRNRRHWVAFEAVKRGKPRKMTASSYIALAPITSRWRKRIGTSTYFDIRGVDSLKGITESATLLTVIPLT